MREAGFMSVFHAKTQEASEAIDLLICGSIDQGLMYPVYQRARRKATLSAPIPILKSIRKNIGLGGSSRGGIPLRIRTHNIRRE